MAYASSDPINLKNSLCFYPPILLNSYPLLRRHFISYLTPSIPSAKDALPIVLHVASIQDSA